MIIPPNMKVGSSKKTKVVKPLSPDEITKNKKNYIHPDIIDIVNKLLSERYTTGSSVTIKQKEISELFFAKNPEIPSDEAYKNHMFDFEDAYRNEGWSVSFDSPCYNENFDSFFKFTKKK